jgi:DNA polymerase III alpha subunit (gram-positive type)
MAFPIQPRRVYTQPVDEWAEACADAEIERMRLARAFYTLQADARLEIARALMAEPDIYAPELAACSLRPILVFDTETTGLSKNDVVIQLGFVCMLPDGTLLDMGEQVWRTDVKCNPMALKVHQIDSHAVANGHDPQLALSEFMNLARRVKRAGGVLVAHNAAFDKRMLQQTADHEGIFFDLGLVFCTANALKNVSPSYRGQTCKNADVYAFLGGEDMNMHQALNDAKATAFIYLRGTELGWW